MYPRGSFPTVLYTIQPIPTGTAIDSSSSSILSHPCERLTRQFGTYLLVCTTCTHQSGHRCPDCFGILLLRCFDVYGSQIGSTESGNPVWTYENRCRPIWAPSYGSSIGRQRAWRTCTAVHVQESATLWNCYRVAPAWSDTGDYTSIHVSDMKLR